MTTFYIVSPFFNSIKFMDAAITSIVSQSGDIAIRYHIQDGGSTDGTVERIKQWEQWLLQPNPLIKCDFKFTWDSRPDKGIYFAINQGFSMMDIPDDGIMCWCNADDMYLPYALSSVAKAFDNVEDLNFLIGRWYNFQFGTLTDRKLHNGAYPREIVENYCCDVSVWSSIAQPSVFWKKSLWDKAGGLNESYKYAADFDLWGRFANHAPPVQLPIVLSVGMIHAEQLTNARQATGGMSFYEQEKESIRAKAQREQFAKKFWSQKILPPVAQVLLLKKNKYILEHIYTWPSMWGSSMKDYIRNMLMMRPKNIVVRLIQRLLFNQQVNNKNERNSVIQAKLYKYDIAYLYNFAALNDYQARLEAFEKYQYIFVESRFNYMLFSLIHPEYEYKRLTGPQFFEKINTHFNQTKYAFRITDLPNTFPRYNFQNVRKFSGTNQKDKNNILICTSIASHNIQIQKYAIKTWIQQGFTVASVNNKNDITKLKIHFPDVNFIQKNSVSCDLLSNEMDNSSVCFLNIIAAMKLYAEKVDAFGIVYPESALYEIDAEQLKSECNSSVIISPSIGMPIEEMHARGAHAIFINQQALESLFSHKETDFTFGEPYAAYYYILLLLSLGHKISKAIPPLCYMQDELLTSNLNFERGAEKLKLFFITNYLKMNIVDSQKLSGRLSLSTPFPIIADLSHYIIQCQPYHCKLIYHKINTTKQQKNSPKKTAIILGNGPSLRGFDFKTNLKNYDTFGMNVAYRYWDTIDWYPTYYSCLDVVVGKSHKNEIERLIKNSDKYGIKLFLLRENLIKELGSTVNNEKIISLESLQKKSPFFKSSRITTGSHTMAWAADLGYKEIVLLGIDANYIEVINEAKIVDGSDRILEITKKVHNNPNYFFDGYQQMGDKYHIPNLNKSNPYDITHLSSWRDLQPALNSACVAVINANPSSNVEVFPKSPFSDIETTLNQERSFLTLRSREENSGLPIFYVVTPAYNAASCIDESINSIVSQSGDFYIHYHVQDGGSTDGTIEKLQKWSDLLSSNSNIITCKGVSFSWSSAKDNGMYEAINRGFDHLRVTDNGLMAWCNTDDKYLPHAFSSVVQAFNLNNEILWLGGGIMMYRSGCLRFAEHFRKSAPNSLIKHGCCDDKFWKTINQSSVFWRKSLWRQAGPLNSSLRYAGDYDLWIRFANKTDLYFLATPLSIFSVSNNQLSRRTDHNNIRLYDLEVDSITPFDVRMQKSKRYWNLLNGRKPTATYIFPEGEKLVIKKQSLVIDPVIKEFARRNNISIAESEDLGKNSPEHNDYKLQNEMTSDNNYIDSYLPELLAKNQQLQTLVDLQKSILRIEAQNSLESRLGAILIKGGSSMGALLTLPARLHRMWRAIETTTPPSRLGGKSFQRIKDEYSVGGQNAVENLLDSVFISPAMRAKAYTALARNLMASDVKKAAEYAFLAYKIDPRPYRLKWLAFREHETGNAIVAEAILAMLPTDITMSESEQRQAASIRKDSSLQRRQKALKDTFFTDYKRTEQAYIVRLAKEAEVAKCTVEQLRQQLFEMQKDGGDALYGHIRRKWKRWLKSAQQ